VRSAGTGCLRPGGDIVLWVIAVILAAVSVLVVYSSTGVEALGAGGSHFRVLVRQLGIVAMGLVVVYAVHKVNYQFYGRIVWVAYGMALAFTVMVYFIGEVNPAAPEAPRWIRIPIVNMTFQPSDFLKVATVMVVARELARRQRTIDRQPVLPPFSVRGWREDGGGKIMRETTLPLLLPIVLSCAVIFSSNLSTALILFATCLVMLFIGRVRIRELAKFFFVMVVFATLIGGTAFVANKIMGSSKNGTTQAAQTADGNNREVLSRSGTWGARIERFFSGEKSYQVEQAEIAIAVGGLTGRGAGESTQRGILPEAESDYAYAFVIEEYGSLIGGLVVLLLYLWVFFRGIVIFRRCGTAFPALLVLGLALLITMQALVNMMVSTNMIPSTGIALPLISKGGSSELFLSCALGMMLGVSRQINDKTLDKPREESLLETSHSAKGSDN
jgi:cell division protein FtsW